MDENIDFDDDSSPNSNLKEQDEGIIEVFARADNRVLTNSEIAKNVTLSKRQVRRRVNDLADRGVIGTRTAGRVKLAWLEKNVKEPITVQYPLLRHVRDHVSIQMFLIGIIAGIVAVLILLAAAITLGYNIPIRYLAREQLLIYGVMAAVLSALFIIAGVLIAIGERAIRYLEINYKMKIGD